MFQRNKSREAGIAGTGHVSYSNQWCCSEEVIMTQRKRNLHFDWPASRMTEPGVGAGEKLQPPKSRFCVCLRVFLRDLSIVWSIKDLPHSAVTTRVPTTQSVSQLGDDGQVNIHLSFNSRTRTGKNMRYVYLLLDFNLFFLGFTFVWRGFTASVNQVRPCDAALKSKQHVASHWKKGRLSHPMRSFTANGRTWQMTQVKQLIFWFGSTWLWILRRRLVSVWFHSEKETERRKCFEGKSRGIF